MSLASAFGCVLLLGAAAFALRYVLVPFLLESLLQAQIRSVSPRSVRGIEWVAKGSQNRGITSRLKIERIGLQRSRRTGGWLTISVEGLTVYITKEGQAPQTETTESRDDSSNVRTTRSRSSSDCGWRSTSWGAKVMGTLKAQSRAWTIFYMSLAVQQSPWLAHLMDLRVEKALLIYRDGSEPPIELVVDHFNACFDVVFDQAPELIKLPSDTCYGGINTPSSPRSPFTEFKSPLESPGFVMNHGLLSPPPSIEVLASEKPMTPSTAPGITKSRPARILSRLLGRARGNATLTMEMGQVSLSETVASMPKTDHVEKVFESVDASRLEVTVQFGDKAGILGEDSVDVKLNISPLSVNVLRMMALQDKLKNRIPRDSAPKRDRAAREARIKDLVNALHSVQLALPYTTARFELEPDQVAEKTENVSGHFDLAVNGFFVDIRSASPSSNSRLKDVFGRTQRQGASVPAVHYSSSIADISVTWQLDRGPSRTVLDIGNLELDGVSTWRLPLWRRNGAMFLDDPNRYIVAASFNVERLHVKTSVPMLSILRPLLKRVRKEKSSGGSTGRLPVSHLPRVLFDGSLGHSTLCILSSDDDSASLLEASSAGVATTVMTEYRDICATRKTRSRDNKAFDEAHQARLADGGASSLDTPGDSDSVDLSERAFTFEAGTLQDDATISMHWDFSLRPGTLRTIVSLAHAEATAYELLKIGNVEIIGEGVVKGGPADPATSHDLSLWWASGIGAINCAFLDGIQATLWHKDAQDHLRHIVRGLESLSPIRAKKVKHPRSHENPLLARLPSGLRLRIAIPSVLVLLASRDPNPACKVNPQRGLQLQLGVILDYCSFNHISQTRRNKLDGKSNSRRRLRLPADATEQAIALHNEVYNQGAQAAHCTVLARQIVVLPVYNAAMPNDRNRPNPRPVPNPASKTFFPRRTRMPSYAGWDFQRVRDQPKPSGDLANGTDPFPISLQDQAQKPLLHIHKIEGGVTLRETCATGDLAVMATVRVAKTKLSADLSHVYCALLALEAIPRPRRPEEARNQKTDAGEASTGSSGISLKLRMNIDEVMGDLALPLKERLFFDLKSVAISSSSPAKEVSVDSSMFYVPSPRAPGRWEEFGRVRRFEVIIDKTEAGKRIATVNIAALRVRIPFRYELSKLVLNFSTMIKAIKLLAQDMRKEEFVSVRKPSAQPPKIIATTTINIGYFSLEIKDDPLETKLNLIWRVGLNEQADRLERMEAFAAKVAVLESTQGAGQGPPLTSSLDDIEARWGFDASGIRDVHSAAYNLAWYSARAWKVRFDKALATQNKREEHLIALVFGVRNREDNLPIDVMPPERFAPLFRAKFEKFTIELKPLDLDKNGIIRHMEDLAGPFPSNTDFSLLVPLAIDMRARSVDLTLRDYPMPLFQIRPSDKQGPDSQDAHSFQASITLVAGEELADDDSYVLLPCPVLPESLGAKHASGLTVQVAKTLMPVKTYTRMEMKVATGTPTDFTWGNSYQPAIEDLTKAFEKFTHPPRDPSPKMGFWDKFRLTLHWRIAVDFDGPCHLHLKGSRDPYHITGFGAGFVLAWMGNVKLRIGEANDQSELIQILSDEMFFSIPDLSAMIDNDATGTHPDLNSDAGKPAAKLPSLLDRRGTKTCARFVGGVRVGFGFKFERTCRDHTCDNDCRGGLSERRCRMFDFKPHHQVKMRTKDVIDSQSRVLGRPVDSYEGFRSDFIHFSPSITTFGRGSPDGTKDECSTNSSSFHFTPKGFTHFFAWWRLFNHVMSLPIRQGKLFPKSPPPHRKFGRSLATIKYRFDIHHLYISHFYPQMSKLDWTVGRQTAVGVKAHIKHFQADLHQREQTKIVRKEALQRMGTVKHKPFYAADIVLDDVRLRALSAVFEDQSKDFLVKHAQHILDVTEPAGRLASDLAHEDSPWFSSDDFVDTDHRPSDGNPHIEMYEIGACPQFHYSRWLPALKLRPDVIDKMKTGHWYGTDMEASKFGREPSHWCLLDEYEGSHKVGIRLAEARRDRLSEALRGCTSKETRYREDSNTLPSQAASLQASIDVLNRFIEDRKAKEAHENQTRKESSSDHLDSRENETEGNDFQNIYQIYTPRLVLNNQSRNILLKYYFSSRLRKGLEYYLSNKALKVLREQLGSITDAPIKNKTVISKPLTPKIPNKLDWMADKTGNVVAKELLKLVLGDSDKQEHDEGEFGMQTPESPDHETDPHTGLPEEYTVTKSHFLSLFGPQLALSSELDEDSTILFCMDSATFKGYTIGDDDFVGDPVNSRVMHRNYSDLSGLQGFYPRRSPDSDERRDRTFVPLEVLLDSKCQSLHFDRVLPKTNGYFHYDKFNQLRLSNDLSADREQYGQDALPEHIQHKQDLAVLHVPRFAVMADSHHYTALYNVITNLILYQDPEQRQRSQKMDTFVYSFDRRDALRYVNEVTSLQQRIRESESLIKAYDEHYAHLTPEGKLGLIDVRGDLLAAVESLNMIYDAVSLHRNYTERAAALKGSIRFQASAGEVAWYMFGQSTLLAKLAMTDTHFDWLRKKDSSTDSTLIVQDLQALNSSPDAVFPEMLAKYSKSGAKEHKPIMKVRWAVLAPVGGITIMERLHVDLHPLRVQLEKKLGRHLMEYVFGENGRPKKQAGGQHASKASQGTNYVGPGEESTALDSRKHEKAQGNRENGSSETRQNSLSETPTADSDKKQVKRQKSGSSVAGDGEQPFLPFEADEMHSRATKNMTFVSISFVQTTLVLSYKGDKPKSITDLYDFKFTCPELRYSNKTWSFENLFQHIRRDVIRSAWQQKGALIREVFKKNRKPTRITAPEAMSIPTSQLRTASRPFDRSPSQTVGQILDSAPLVRSPAEEEDFRDLERTPTVESFESGHAHGERDRSGKLGKLVHKIKARAAHR